MVSKGNHPRIALIQIGEIVKFTQKHGLLENPLQYLHASFPSELNLHG